MFHKTGLLATEPLEATSEEKSNLIAGGQQKLVSLQFVENDRRRRA
jgi:hypothetical protein